MRRGGIEDWTGVNVPGRRDWQGRSWIGDMLLAMARKCIGNVYHYGRTENNTRTYKLEEITEGEERSRRRE